MACPKGWEALAPLARARPRHHAAAAQRQAAGSTRSTGPTRSTRSCDRIKAIQAEHGPESVAFLSTGQIATEEMALLGALAKFGMGMRPRRRQHAPVHGHAPSSRTSSRSASTRRRTPTPTSRSPTCIVLVGANLCIAHPILWQRVMRNPQRPGDHRRSIRGATETAMAATLHLRAPPEVATSRCSTAWRNLLIAARLDRPRLHRTRTPAASTTFAAFVARLHARARRRRRRGSAGRASSASPTRSTTAKRVSFWWTMGVNQSHRGRPHGAGDHQPGADDRQHRPAGHRRQLDHRPVQRDGLAAVLQHDRTCSAATTSPTPTHRAQGRRRPRHRRGRDPGRAELAYDQILEGIARGEIRGPVGHRHQPAPTRGSTRARPASCSSGSTSSSCRTCTTTTETAQLRRPRAARRRLGREGRHVHQLRAADRPRAEGRARPGAGARRLPHLQARRRLLGLRRPVPPLDRPRGDVRASSRSCPTGRPCDIDRGRRLRARRPGHGPVAVPGSGVAGRAAGREPGAAGAADDPTERRLFADGRFSTPDGRARFLFEEPEAPGGPDDALPARAADRARVGEPVAHRDPHREVGHARGRSPPTGSGSRSTPTTPRPAASPPATTWSCRLGAGSVDAACPW